MKYKSKLATLLTLLLLPTAVILAAEPVKTLVGIPGISDVNLNFGAYINALYSLSISIAALLAVIKIVIAGLKYMLSDVVSTKSAAISDIKGALLGLLIVISAVLILRFINPQLTETDIFLDPVVNKPGSLVGSGAGVGGGPVPTPPVTAQMATSSCLSKNNCIAAETDCRARGGTPGTSRNGFGFPIYSESACTFGTEIFESCKVLSSTDQGIQYTCTEAKQKCALKGGTSYTGNADSNIKCVYPKNP